MESILVYLISVSKNDPGDKIKDQVRVVVVYIFHPGLYYRHHCVHEHVVFKGFLASLYLLLKAFSHM